MIETLESRTLLTITATLDFTGTIATFQGVPDLTGGVLQISVDSFSGLLFHNQNFTDPFDFDSSIPGSQPLAAINSNSVEFFASAPSTFQLGPAPQSLGAEFAFYGFPQGTMGPSIPGTNNLILDFQGTGGGEVNPIEGTTVDFSSNPFGEPNEVPNVVRINNATIATVRVADLRITDDTSGLLFLRSAGGTEGTVDFGTGGSSQVTPLIDITGSSLPLVAVSFPNTANEIELMNEAVGGPSVLRLQDSIQEYRNRLRYNNQTEQLNLLGGSLRNDALRINLSNGNPIPTINPLGVIFSGGTSSGTDQLVVENGVVTNAGYFAGTTPAFGDLNLDGHTIRFQDVDAPTSLGGATIQNLLVQFPDIPGFVNNIELTRASATSPLLLRHNGVDMLTFADSTPTAITGDQGDDYLRINLANANAIPVPGLSFNGGRGTNQTVILGGMITNANYAVITVGSGTLLLDARTVTLQNAGLLGLFPDTLTNLTVDLPDTSPNQVELLNDDGDGGLTLAGNTLMGFTPPMNAFTLIGGAANDDFTVQSLPPGFDAAVVLDGQGGNDVFRISGATGNGPFAILGGGGVNQLELDLPINLLTSAGLTFQGSGNDQIRVRGSLISNAVYAATGPRAGRLELDGKIITFTGVNPDAGIELIPTRLDALTVSTADGFAQAFIVLFDALQGEVRLVSNNLTDIRCTPPDAVTVNGTADNDVFEVGGTFDATWTLTVDGGAGDDMFWVAGQFLNAMTVYTFNDGGGAKDTFMLDTGTINVIEYAVTPGSGLIQYPYPFTGAVTTLNLVGQGFEDVQDRSFTTTNANDFGLGSMRSALINANRVTDPVITIGFTGSFLIGLQSPLPTVTRRVIIDAASVGTVVLDGMNAGANACGLTLSGPNAAGSRIANLTIRGFSESGISVRTDGAVIEANAVYGNARYGITVQQASGAILQGNVIGLESRDARSVSATYGGNGGDGIFLWNSANNLILNNVIAGNAYPTRKAPAFPNPFYSPPRPRGLPPWSYLGNGIRLSGSGSQGNRIEANFLGANQNGVAIQNQAYAVLIEPGAFGNVITRSNFAPRNTSYDPLVTYRNMNTQPERGARPIADDGNVIEGVRASRRARPRGPLAIRLGLLRNHRRMAL
jgi:hypothetical protein